MPRAGELEKTVFDTTRIPPADTTFLVARKPSEMKRSQAHLMDWFRTKITKENSELSSFMQMVLHAKKRKWKITSLQARMKRQVERVRFYQHGLRALENGYTLIPEFPMDVVAIRLKRKAPRSKKVHSTTYGSGATHLVPDENPQRLPEGEGRYVSPNQTMSTWSDKETIDGKEKTRHYAEASELQVPEFPITVATPLVLDAAYQAMAEKLFDEIGICPQGQTRGDPIVIGTILGPPAGYAQKRLHFLISWCIDVRTL